MLGRDHAVVRRNRQDAADARAGDGWVFGVVSDGCGQAASSELGASLTVVAASAALESALCAGAPFDGLGERVLEAVLDALEAVTRAVAPAQVERVVRTHLLATLVGFAARDREACVFWAGDGGILLGGEVAILERDNRPDYPAYALLGARRSLAARVVEAPRVLAVATDGLDRETLLALSSSPRSGAALGRRLVISQRAGALADDGAIAIAWTEAPSCGS